MERGRRKEERGKRKEEGVGEMGREERRARNIGSKHRCKRLQLS